MTPLSEDDRFNLEVLKLLLHVAWADGVVQRQEAQVIIGLGRSWAVPEGHLQTLKLLLDRDPRPPEPDWALLKQRADEAVEAARALIVADGKIDAREQQVIARVTAALR